jgi:hypothetical protein
MSQDSNGLAQDEETHLKTVASHWIETDEGLKDSRHALLREAGAGVTDIYPDALAGVPAAQENAAAALCLLDSIAYQVAQDVSKEERVAQNWSGRGDRTNADALLQGPLFVLTAGTLQQRPDAHGRQLDLFAAFTDPKCGKQLLDLLLETAHCALSAEQQTQLGIGPDTEAKKLVGALNDLQWLPKIVPCDGKQHGVELGTCSRPRKSGQPPWKLIAFDMVRAVHDALARLARSIKGLLQ